MKKLLKKMQILTVMLLAFTMLMGSVSVVGAEQDLGVLVEQNTKGTIHITGVGEGDTVTLVKIMDTVYDKDQNSLTFSFANDKIAEIMKNAGFTTYGAYMEASFDNTNFKNAMDAVMKDSTLTSYKKKTEENGTGEVTFTNVDLGQYFVKIATVSGHIYQPITAEVIPAAGSNGKYYLKTETVDLERTKVTKPNVTKTMDKSGALEVGDTINFTVTVNVPLYTDAYTKPTLKVIDTMDKHLKIDATSINVSCDSSLLNNEYTSSVQTTQDGKNVLTIKFDYAKLKENNHVNHTVTITYAATLVNTDDLDLPMKEDVKNHVEYQYTTKLDGSVDKVEAETATRTYGLRIYKYDGGDGTTPLSGVTFRIYRVNPGSGTKEYLKFNTKADSAVIDGSGNPYSYTKYCVDPSGETEEFVTDGKGFVGIRGLGEGTYYLEEKDTVFGYNKLDKEVKIEIKAADVNERGFLVKNIANYKQNYILPSTGGNGTWFYIVGGIVLMGAAVGILLFVKSREKKNAA